MMSMMMMATMTMMVMMVMMMMMATMTLMIMMMKTLSIDQYCCLMMIKIRFQSLVFMFDLAFGRKLKPFLRLLIF